MAIVHTQVAYILHKRDYRETSSIIELLTGEFGRIALIARGSRGSKSRIAGSLMAFSPLLVSWQGRGDLPYLKSVERAGLVPPELKANALYSAMYINELLMYLVQRHDVHDGLFEKYHECLCGLSEGDIELALRRFELELLELLGFAINLDHEAESSLTPRSDRDYRYVPGYGLIDVSGSAASCSDKLLNDHGVLVSGRCITTLSKHGVEAFAGQADLLRELKMLMRCVLDHQLGGRKLRSRELFRSLYSRQPANFKS